MRALQIPVASRPQAATAARVNGFDLNRLRNRPAEDSLSPVAASIDEQGFVYARDAIAKAIAQTGGSVRELHREAPTLERLFVRILEEPEGDT